MGIIIPIVRLYRGVADLPAILGLGVVRFGLFPIPALANHFKFPALERREDLGICRHKTQST